MSAEILVIDDQDRTIDLCRRVMPEHIWHGPARCWRDAEQILQDVGDRIGLVLLDLNFDIPEDQLLGLSAGADPRAIRAAQRRQGIEILAALRRGQPDLPVVLMTSGGGDLERAADRHGAEEYTYFLDDEDLDASALRAQVGGILQLQDAAERDGPVYWGRSLTMRRIRQRLRTLARGRLPVILAGPTGTGKSLMARHFVHQRSGRKGAFVAVDLSTVPADLVAAHLFGATRGAYTGSVGDRRGAFEEADGGTLFLDEVGNLSEGHQKLLLTVLQESAVTRLGDTRERRVDVKLVVATNEDLGQLVRAGRFRADLYMRLNPAATVQLPSLRDRRLDIDRLLRFTVGRIVSQSYFGELLAEYAERCGLADPRPTARVALRGRLPGASPGVVVLLFPDRTLRELRQHGWPGNLREFAMTVENALTLSIAEAIEAGRTPGSGPAANRDDVVQVRPKLVRDLLRAVDLGGAPEDGGWRVDVSVHANGTLNKVAQDVERQYFVQLFHRERGDFAAMAQVLLGDADGGRKVQLRLNQLGLKVRELRAQLS